MGKGLKKMGEFIYIYKLYKRVCCLYIDYLTVGQGPTALAVGAGGGCLDIFTLLYLFSPISPSLWETA